MEDPIYTYLVESGWEVRFEDCRPPESGELFKVDDLGLSRASMRTLEPFGGLVYRHQRESMRLYSAGSNVAVTTSTASGKTLIFNLGALEEISSRPTARVLAVYPLKALAAEQTKRWQRLSEVSGMEFKVGRIDGGVPTRERPRILRESRVVVVTPDVIHAWMLWSISSPEVLTFLRDLALVVIDEAHTYSGVFGSNSAFLFRRVLHATRKLGGRPKFIASSATMSDPQSHLQCLTGEQFEVVGPELDTSPCAELRTMLVTPPESTDLLTAISDLIAFAASKTEHQSITFVDSRKQTEYLASIIERRMSGGPDTSDEIDFDGLRDLQIYPYRSGYEEEDRQRIQDRLAAGVMRGVVSTSALEMGIDLPFLSLGILVGIPRSATSLYQRIGRVGRRKPGLVVIVNNGSVMSETIFRSPERLKALPFSSSALYLHNQRIQYIHAMCLARVGGEDDLVCDRVGLDSQKFSSSAQFAADFQALCESERVGEINAELQSMKAQSGDDPHHTFPLRDLDVQYKVEHRQGPHLHSLGALSYAQVMREAYPGAVYYYQSRPYRVVRVRKHQRTIEVRPEKRYFTSPTFLPTLILPNLVDENVFDCLRYGDLSVIECALQVGEAVIGYTERRGNTELAVTYPLDRATGVFHDAARFTRYAFTSGVVLTHPSLGRDGVKLSALAEVLEEAFLMSLPFERQDISAGADKHRATRGEVQEGSRFLCVYDQTYGSLRLTSHLMKTEILRSVLAQAKEIAFNDSNVGLSSEAIQALEEIVESVMREPDRPKLGPSRGIEDGEFVEVIMPGSRGVNVYRDNEEFEVERVFYSPQFGCLAYRGKHASEKARAERESWRHSQTTITVRMDHIMPLSGESKVGFYSLETGELMDAKPLAGEF